MNEIVEIRYIGNGNIFAVSSNVAIYTIIYSVFFIQIENKDICSVNRSSIAPVVTLKSSPILVFTPLVGTVMTFYPTVDSASIGFWPYSANAD